MAQRDDPVTDGDFGWPVSLHEGPGQMSPSVRCGPAEAKRTVPNLVASPATIHVVPL